MENANQNPAPEAPTTTAHGEKLAKRLVEALAAGLKVAHCSGCAGRGWNLDMHYWSDGWGHVEATCSRCQGDGIEPTVESLLEERNRLGGMVYNARAPLEFLCKAAIHSIMTTLATRSYPDPNAVWGLEKAESVGVLDALTVARCLDHGGAMDFKSFTALTKHATTEANRRRGEEEDAKRTEETRLYQEGEKRKKEARIQAEGKPRLNKILGPKSAYSVTLEGVDLGSIQKGPDGWRVAVSEFNVLGLDVEVKRCYPLRAHSTREDAVDFLIRASHAAIAQAIGLTFSAFQEMK